MEPDNILPENVLMKSVQGRQERARLSAKTFSGPPARTDRLKLYKLNWKDLHSGGE